VNQLRLPEKNSEELMLILPGNQYNKKGFMAWLPLKSEAYYPAVFISELNRIVDKNIPIMLKNRRGKCRQF
jgi:hypothetical protein